MQSNNPETALERIAARYERRLETVRRIQELIQDDPSLASEIVAALNGCAQTPSRQSKTTPTSFERIEVLFNERENAWISAPEIAKALSISRGTLGQVLYQTYADRFEKKAQPDNKKVKLWRLRTEVSR